MIKSTLEWTKHLEDKLQNFKLYIRDPEITKQKLNLGDDNSFIILEEFFFSLSFIIRKIYESKKISQELFDENIIVKRFNNRELDPGETSSEFFHISYNLNEYEGYKATLRFICNQFIHSFIFIPMENIAWPYSTERYLMKGIYINSDETKRKYLFYVDIVDYIKLVEKTIRNISPLRKIKLVK